MKKFFVMCVAMMACFVAVSAQEQEPVETPNPDEGWTEWLPMGTVDVTYCGAVNADLPLSMRVSVDDPNHSQYKIDGYLITNVEGEQSRPLIFEVLGSRGIYVPRQELPPLNIKDGDSDTIYTGKLSVTDLATFKDMVGLRDFFEYDTKALSFDLWMAYYREDGTLLNVADPVEKVRLHIAGWVKAPVAHTFGGDTSGGELPIELGAHVASYKYAVAKGGGIAMARKLGARVAANDSKLTIVSATPEEMPQLQFNEGSGRYTVGFCTYDAKGKKLETTEVRVYYMPREADKWESVGRAEVVDGFLADVYDFEPTPYDVEVERSVETPGLYRVVDLFGSTHPYAAEVRERKFDFPVYTYINCSDPEACYIYETSTGVVFDSSGEILVSSTPERVLNEEGISIAGQKKSTPEAFGRRKDGEVTFSRGSLLCSAAVLLEAGYGWLEMARKTPFTLKFPAAGVDGIEASASDGACGYYTLQGVAVSEPQPGQIYVERRHSDGTSRLVRK